MGIMGEFTLASRRSPKRNEGQVPFLTLNKRGWKCDNVGNVKGDGVPLTNARARLMTPTAQAFVMVRTVP
jgi:hypothetical protein